MVGIYFSGTGNTQFCVEQFLNQYDSNAAAFSIENDLVLEQIKVNNDILLAYPIQYSNLPKIVNDFIIRNAVLWNDKKIFIITTMGLWSGDGAGLSARPLQRYGAKIIGGLHLQMPNSISDVKSRNRPLHKNRQIVKNAIEKSRTAANNLINGHASQDGLSVFNHLAGLFGQRLYFYHKTKSYTDKLKINTIHCIGCSLCAMNCPMNNITIKNKKATAGRKCTMCYRCINHCPTQAITLLGTQVIEQCKIERYI